MGYNKVDARAVSAAVAGDTLFIHGSSVEGGSGTIKMSRHLSSDLGAERVSQCEAACGSHEAGLPPGLSTVCDPSCDSNGRYASHLCGAGDPNKYGSMCRLCYTDQRAALIAEAELRRGDSPYEEPKHVIMCGTRRPPNALECTSKCGLKTDTVRPRSRDDWCCPPRIFMVKTRRYNLDLSLLNKS